MNTVGIRNQPRRLHKFRIGSAFGILALSILPLANASAGDAAIGKSLAGPCAACHGEAGAAPIANYPVLAGQHKDYLLQVLIDYKKGTRPDPVMSAQVAQFSKADLENLAAYFATQGSELR